LHPSSPIPAARQHRIPILIPPCRGLTSNRHATRTALPPQAAADKRDGGEGAEILPQPLRPDLSAADRKTLLAQTALASGCPLDSKDPRSGLRSPRAWRRDSQVWMAADPLPSATIAL
jgi:hypothetical protein